MACQRARRRRERDCDIIGQVTRPSLRAGGDRARSEGRAAPDGDPAARGNVRRDRRAATSGEIGARRVRIAPERELERVSGAPP